MSAMKDMTVDKMLENMRREIGLLRKENSSGDYDFKSHRDKEECDRLVNLYNEIAYFRREYC
ncbi:hypothetical protein CON36_31725 [Bacillus cereus]|uniref:Uncharacterized protein n=1 Tax=Bacillus cereus TaxID=1396 RepID=A0A9X6STF8_BACCE|nr:hypothetical protein [Bacillus cereus]PDZ94827.1 hypothetical protein CON36_31725 [Bacillus cereus]